jgi:hypothetical protein
MAVTELQKDIHMKKLVTYIAASFMFSAVANATDVQIFDSLSGDWHVTGYISNDENPDFCVATKASANGSAFMLRRDKGNEKFNLYVVNRDWLITSPNDAVIRSDVSFTGGQEKNETLNIPLIVMDKNAIAFKPFDFHLGDRFVTHNTITINIPNSVLTAGSKTAYSVDLTDFVAMAPTFDKCHESLVNY